MKIFISILLGILCLYFSQFGIKVFIGITRIDIPWSIIFPLLSSIAFGPRYGLISGLAGGAFFPFLLWSNNGWANVLTFILILIFYFLIGLINSNKIWRNNFSAILRLSILLGSFIILFSASFLLLFNPLLSLNPPFWTSIYITSIGNDLLVSFIIKDSINFILLSISAETFLRLPFLRAFLKLEIFSHMRMNNKIFLTTMVSALVMWVTFVLLSVVLFENINHLSDGHLPLAFLVIISGGIFSARALMLYVERKIIAEDALRKSEIKFRSLFEQASVGVANIETATGKFLRVNKKYAELTGYSIEDLLTLDFQSITHPEDLQKDISYMKRLVNGEIRDFNLEKRYYRKDGSMVWVDLSVSAIWTPGEAPLSHLAIVQDITAKKEAEKKLKLLAHSLESITECVSITDCNDIILYVNEAFLKTYGYKEEEVIGEHIKILRPADYSENITTEILPKTLKGGWRGEVINCKKDGTKFPLLLSTSALVDENKNPIALIGVAIDISEMKKVNQELMIAKEQADKSNRLKTEFLAQMSHEIRSPLSSIMSFNHLIKEDLNEFITPEVEEYFTVINSASTRLIRTIELILNMSEMQIGSYQSFPKKIDLFNDVLNGIIKEYSNAAQAKQLEFILNCPKPDIKIFADLYSITQIFANLIDNSIKYTKQGFITLSIVENKSNNCVEVTVEDSGIGMTEEYLSSIFEPFVQEEGGYSRRFEGNGLGLALVKKYCDLNNVRIRIESEKNVGSKFILVFPGVLE
ncbi:MAG: PAS domain S-box protein [Bacteroidetes bacterium]|nr:PAS domain S-box protein [Bacteroidota bacterium]